MNVHIGIVKVTKEAKQKNNQDTLQMSIKYYSTPLNMLDDRMMLMVSSTIR